jgi:hypothetical protein
MYHLSDIGYATYTFGYGVYRQGLRRMPARSEGDNVLMLRRSSPKLRILTIADVCANPHDNSAHESVCMSNPIGGFGTSI